MALGLSLFDPHTLFGALGPVLFFLAVIAGAWSYLRVNVAKAKDAAIDTWRENAEAEKSRAERLELDLERQREEKHQALNELALERLKTDQTQVMKEILAFHADFAQRELLFKEILESLANSRKDFIDHLTLAQQEGVSKVSVELKLMEERLVGALGHQVELLVAIGEKLNGS